MNYYNAIIDTIISDNIYKFENTFRTHTCSEDNIVISIQTYHDLSLE